MKQNINEEVMQPSEPLSDFAGNADTNLDFTRPLSGQPSPISEVEQKLERYLSQREWAWGRRWNHTIHPKPLEPSFRVDLIWDDASLIVELDGPEHARVRYEEDRRRDRALQQCGYQVLRFTNAEVRNDISRVATEIEGFLLPRREPMSVDLPTLTLEADIDEIAVLREINIETVVPRKSIWRDDTVVVEALHREALDEVIHRRQQLRQGLPRKNVVLEGPSGVGKSHFLGRVRRDTIDAGDFFVAVELNQASDFWTSAALDIQNAFCQIRSQRAQLLEAIFNACELERVLGTLFIQGIVDEGLLPVLRLKIRQKLQRGTEAELAADMAIAIILLGSEDDDHYDIGYAFFGGTPISDAQRERVGIRAHQITPRDVVKSVDRLVSFVGRVMVVALDQLDGLVAIAKHPRAKDNRLDLDVISNNLMELVQVTQKSMVILSCIGLSWELLREQMLKSTQYRFQDVLHLKNLPSSECGYDLIATVLAREFRRLNYQPAWPTWPISEGAFKSADRYTARELIEQVISHIRHCVDTRTVTPLVQLGDIQRPSPSCILSSPESLELVQSQFETMVAEAEVPPLSSEQIERILPVFLHSALEAFIIENEARFSMRVDWFDIHDPPIDLRLRIVIDAKLENEEHWSFKVLTHAQSIAQVRRLQTAVARSGLGLQRNLIVIRNGPWAHGPRIAEILQRLDEAGGLVHMLTSSELQQLSALRRILRERPPGLREWLQKQRPASCSALLKKIFSPGGAFGIHRAVESLIISHAPSETENITNKETLTPNPSEPVLSNSDIDINRISSTQEDSPLYNVMLGVTRPSGQYGLLGEIEASGHIVALDLNHTHTISLFGVQGGGKSYTLGTVAEMASRPLDKINRLPQPLSTIIFHYSPTMDYAPEFTSMVAPNNNEAQIAKLRARYGAEPCALEDVVLLVPADKLDERRSEYPSIEVYPLKFAANELQASHWRFLMGAVGNTANYVKQLGRIMRGLRNELTLDGLEQAINDATMSDNIKWLARSRLDLAREFIHDHNTCLGEVVRPGRLVIVDLRDEFIEKDQALGLFVVLLQLFSEVKFEGNKFNKLVVFDEAHKYISNPELVASLVEVVREMRHKGTSIMVASQDPPSVPVQLIELSSQIILHKFNAPTWLKHIQKANAAIGQLTPAQMAALRPGEAFVWSSKATDETFSREMVKIRCRPRVTQHGGATITAVKE